MKRIALSAAVAAALLSPATASATPWFTTAAGPSCELVSWPSVVQCWSTSGVTFQVTRLGPATTWIDGNNIDRDEGTDWMQLPVGWTLKRSLGYSCTAYPWGVRCYSRWTGHGAWLTQTRAHAF